MTLHINEVGSQKRIHDAIGDRSGREDFARGRLRAKCWCIRGRRFELPGGAFFHHMAAADVPGDFVATKQYTYVGGKLKFVVSLFSTETGDLLALIEADYLGQMRTGAASGVATKYLARKGADTAAIIGTGGQARTQLEAIAVTGNSNSPRRYMDAMRSGEKNLPEKCPRSWAFR